MTGVLATTGAAFLRVAQETGGMALIGIRALAALAPPRLDWDGFLRALHRFGVMSLPIVMATAFLTGLIVLLQAAVYVESYGATVLVGWGTGWVTFREIGPVLIALMFSGRVGSTNAAELATMTVTEQIDALRALAIDPFQYLVVPRLFAMVLANLSLTIIGNILAIAGGALAGKVLIGVDFAEFWASFSEYVFLSDALVGTLKGGVFGLAIGIVSSHFGLSVTGGVPGVGRSVNRAVVASAVLIFVLDYFITYTVGVGG